MNNLKKIQLTIHCSWKAETTLLEDWKASFKNLLQIRSGVKDWNKSPKSQVGVLTTTLYVKSNACDTSEKPDPADAHWKCLQEMDLMEQIDMINLVEQKHLSRVTSIPS